MNLKLRRMEAGDVPALEDLEKACFSEPWSARLLTDLLSSQYDETWLLEEKDAEEAAPKGGAAPKGEAGSPDTGFAGVRLAGYANFRFLGDEGELMRIAVAPEFRGRGYSRKLMERLDRSAAERGAAVLMLEVRVGNAPARKLYESCGFSQIAVRKDYYRLPVEDAIVMTRQNLLGITT